MRIGSILLVACSLMAAAALAAGCGGDGGTTAAEPAPPASTEAAPAPPTPSPPPPPQASQSRSAAKKSSPPPVAEAPSAVTPASPSKPQAQERYCAPGSVHAVGDDVVTFAAIARRATTARRTPNGVILGSFGLTNANGHVTVFEIRGVTRDGCGRVWYYAKLPIRPNGIAGFVLARDVYVRKLRTRIVIDLSRRRLVFYQNRAPVLTSSVAVGAPGTPTPTGRYYVNQRLIVSNPNGPYGPAALGISAFSDVLQGWTQGGPIGIHGTNAPWSIGKAVSHGCIRLPNPVLRRLFAAAPAGTPVVIRA